VNGAIKPNKKYKEDDLEVELKCDDCKKQFNNEYNMHVHMESESHFARVAAIKRLYQEPPPEKQPTDMK